MSSDRGKDTYAQRLRNRAPPAISIPASAAPFIHADMPEFKTLFSSSAKGNGAVVDDRSRISLAAGGASVPSSCGSLTLTTSKISNSGGNSTNTQSRSHSLVKKTLTMLWWSPPRQLDLEGVEVPSPRDAEVERVAAQLPPEAARLYRFLGKEGFKRLMMSFYADCRVSEECATTGQKTK